MSHLPHVTQAQRETGRALALAAMAVGLVAVLTLVVSWLYAPNGLLVSTFLGIIAAGLGIAALVSRQRPVAASIAGLISGAVTVLITLCITFIGANGGAFSLGLQPGGSGGSVEDGSGQLLLDGRTPLNMASGGAVFGKDQVVQETSRFDPRVGPVTDLSARETGVVDITVYVDYRCPYCSLFEQLEGGTLQEAMQTGVATVEIRPLTFMDPYSTDGSYSSRAAALFACTVETQPDDAWNVHSMLLHPEVQPKNEHGHTNDDLLELTAIAVGGESVVSDNLAECVTSERLVPYSSAFTEWSTMNAIPGATDESLRATSTPYILVNGQVSSFDRNDRELFRSHLLAAGVPLA